MLLFLLVINNIYAYYHYKVFMIIELILINIFSINLFIKKY